MNHSATDSLSRRSIRSDDARVHLEKRGCLKHERRITPTFLHRIASFLLLIGLCAGCSKSDQPAASSVSVEQAPATIEGAFKNAAPEVQQQATEAVASLQSQNDTAAFVQLENLSGRSDLTAEQRQAAFAAWMAINARLQQSAANGNSAAQQVLEKYRATK